MRYLSLCLITKDEHLYLPEWLDWHRKLGVEHFYIYDNGTHDHLSSLLTQDDVTLHRVLGLACKWQPIAIASLSMGTSPIGLDSLILMNSSSPGN